MLEAVRLKAYYNPRSGLPGRGFIFDLCTPVMGEHIGVDSDAAKSSALVTRTSLDQTEKKRIEIN